MSWDVLVFNSNQPVDLEAGDWPDFPSREFVIERISQTFPGSNWNDPAWGLLSNELIDVEFNIGSPEKLGGDFMLHIRGGADPLGEITRLCKQHGWIAYDTASDDFIDNNKPSDSGLKEWSAYRDHVTAPVQKKKPWWKFW